MGSDGNKLPVGNALAIERMYLSVITKSGASVTAVTGLFFTGAYANLTVGELNIIIANSQVLKQVALLSQDPRFNKNSTFFDYNNFEFDTQLVLNPLLEFVFNVKVNAYTPIVDNYLRLTVEGVGAIIAPRTTM